jgi:hypothetical protein
MTGQNILVAPPLHPIGRTDNRGTDPFTFLLMAILSLIFTIAGIVLLNQPMGMRHGM